MRVRKFEKIECPKCGYEYLPAQIFVPKYFFGIPEMIERDENGKLLSYEGSSVDLFEKYKCDNCNVEFRIVSKLQLTTELDYPKAFHDDEYVTKIDKNLFDDNN